MNVELVAQMFKNYRSNVLFHLEGKHFPGLLCGRRALVTPNMSVCSNGQSSGSFLGVGQNSVGRIELAEAICVCIHVDEVINRKTALQRYTVGGIESNI